MPETPTENFEEPKAPIEPEELDPYPYPEPGKEVVPPTDLGEPYPNPVTEPDSATVINPYPGVEDPELIQAPIIVDGFAPVSLDKNFNRGPAFIDSMDIVLKESFPVQVELVLTGHLPTPCHQLRVVAADPDTVGNIEVEVYSVSDPDKMCIQVLEPFEAVFPLGEYTEGNYTVSINEELTGEFKLP